MAGRQRRVTALEIGAHGLKRLVLEETPAGVAIRQLDVVALPAPAENRPWTARLQDALAQLTQKAQVAQAAPMAQRPGATGHPHACIDLQQVTTRYFVIPRTSEENVRRAVAAEVETEIPLPFDQLVWDYRVMNGRTDGEQMDVLVAGVRGDLVTDVVGRLAAAGMAPRSMGVSSLAAFAGYQMSPQAKTSGTVALVDISENRTTITIGNTETLYYTRSLAAPAPDAPAGVDVLAQECQRTLNFLEKSHKRSPRVACVYLCGHGSDSATLRSELERRLGVPVSAYDPLSPLTLDGGVAPSPEERRGLAVCVGAALTALRSETPSIDLLPEALLPRAAGARWAGILSPGLAAAAVSVLLLLAAGLLLYMKPVLQLRTLERELSRQPGLAADVAALDRQLSALDTIREERVRWTRVLREMADLLPRHVIVIDFEFTGPNHVAVNLKMGNPSEAPDMARLFEESPLFEEARYGNIEFDNQGCRTRITVRLTDLKPGEYDTLKAAAGSTPAPRDESRESRRRSRRGEGNESAPPSPAPEAAAEPAQQTPPPPTAVATPPGGDTPSEPPPRSRREGPGRRSGDGSVRPALQLTPVNSSDVIAPEAPVAPMAPAGQVDLRSAMQPEGEQG